ncbi:MAG: hypothetical protein J6I85_06845 [Clostridia bacterium]|nr:hypothetical protein [Clostridia bacterium]
MSFIDRIKGLFNKNKRLEAGETSQIVYNTKEADRKIENVKDDMRPKKVNGDSFEINIGNKENVRVYNLKELSTVPRDDGESVMYDAQIICHKEGDAIYLSDYDDHIGFEVLPNQNLNDVLQYFVTKYFEENAKEPEKSEYYLGRMKETSNHTVDENYQSVFEEEDKYLEQAYLETIKADEKKQREEFLDRIDAREDVMRNALEAEKKNKLERINRIKRLQNPSLIPVVQSDEMTLEFKGVNLSEGEKQGNILLLEKLELINEGKEDIPNLYKAVIKNIESDMYKSKRYEENEICFEIANREFEQIVNDANTDEVKAFLQLLSDPSIFENKNEIRYIGKLEKLDGEFKIIRQDEPETQENADFVKQIKENYRNFNGKEL